MKESAKAQHEVDKAQFEAAKAIGDPKKHKAKMKEERNAQINAAKERTAAANDRINAAKESK